MIGFAGLTFAAPWALAALAVLPAIWWLLRVTPPPPRRVVFPPVRLLLDLRAGEETPARTPPWLLLLRLFAAALAILAVARPLLDAAPGSGRGGPLVVVVDDGWAAAPGWERRAALGRALVENAGLDGRSVLVAGTAPVSAGGPGGGAGFAIGALTGAADALAALAALEPKPWPTDRAGFAAAFESAAPPLDGAEVAWLGDGIADPDPADTERFLAALESVGPIAAFADPPEDQIGRAHV